MHNSQANNYFKIIVMLCLISSLSRFVLDSYLPSLVAISDYFYISAGDAQLTLTVYLLGFSLSQLIYGPLSDCYGRRNVMLIGLLIFVSGNLLCAIATSPLVLLLGRLVAGIGAGSCGVLNRAIASDCFKGKEFSKAWSYTTTTLVITLCVAPVLGGYVQQLLGWRANFALATFYTAVVLFILLKFLPETNHRNKTEHAHVSSMKIKRICQNYYDILCTPSFIVGTLSYTFAFAGLIAYFQVSPVLFIDGFQLSPSEYGWCSVIIAANYLMGGLIVKRTVHYIGTKSLLCIGAVLLICGGALMLAAYLFKYTTISAILLPACIYVLGARLVIPNAIANSLEQVSHLGGSSSAMIGFIQMLGSSLISCLISESSNASPFALATLLTALGFITLMLSLLAKKHSHI